jgi:hypothetical protein
MFCVNQQWGGQSCRRPSNGGLKPNATYFSERWGSGSMVGRTPWSARDALVPLFLRGISTCHHRRAGQEAGSGPGVPPHQLCRCALVGNLSGIGLKPTPPSDRRVLVAWASARRRWCEVSPASCLAGIVSEAREIRIALGRPAESRGRPFGTAKTCLAGCGQRPWHAECLPHLTSQTVDRPMWGRRFHPPSWAETVH